MKRGTFVECKGLQEVNANFNRLIADVDVCLLKSFTDVCLDLLSESVKKAPVDTGALRSSGYCIINDNPAFRVVPAIPADVKHKKGVSAPSSFRVVAGKKPTKSAKYTAKIGFSTRYATVQHEMTNYTHPRGGQAKFLEEPFRQNSNRYKEILEKGFVEGCVRE